jgi:hypothetical protein
MQFKTDRIETRHTLLQRNFQILSVTVTALRRGFQRRRGFQHNFQILSVTALRRGTRCSSADAASSAISRSCRWPPWDAAHAVPAQFPDPADTACRTDYEVLKLSIFGGRIETRHTLFQRNFQLFQRNFQIHTLFQRNFQLFQRNFQILQIQPCRTDYEDDTSGSPEVDSVTITVVEDALKLPIFGDRIETRHKLFQRYLRRGTPLAVVMIL